jgi:long-chain acyl-CoA synthetase
MGRAHAATGRLPVRTLSELFTTTAEQFAARPALRFFGRVTTYSELAAQVDAIAAGLDALGVRAGDRVGLLLPNTPTFAAYFFAAQRLGAVVVNTNYLQDADDLAAQFTETGTRVLITLDLAALFTKAEAVLAHLASATLVVASFPAQLPPAKGFLFRVKRARDLVDPTRSPHAARIVSEATMLARASGDMKPSPVDPGGLAVLRYTGGTTRTPKAVMLTHANLTANVAQLTAWAGARIAPGRERVLGVLPLFHIFGLTSVLLVGITTGTELVLLPRFDIDRLTETIRGTSPTLLPGVPTLFSTLLDHPSAATLDLTTVTLALSGGAPLPPDIAARFERRAKTTLVDA